jgi:hypothetical protein
VGEPGLASGGTTVVELWMMAPPKDRLQVSPAGPGVANGPTEAAQKLPMRSDSSHHLRQQPGGNQLLTVCVWVPTIHCDVLRRDMPIDKDDLDISGGKARDDSVNVSLCLIGSNATFAIVGSGRSGARPVRFRLEQQNQFSPACLMTCRQKFPHCEC